MTNAQTAFRDGEEYPIIDTPCVKCKYPRSRYAPPTIFYECCLCGHRFSHDDIVFTPTDEQKRIKQMRDMIEKMKADETSIRPFTSYIDAGQNDGSVQVYTQPAGTADSPLTVGIDLRADADGEIYYTVSGAEANTNLTLKIDTVCYENQSTSEIVDEICRLLSNGW